MITRFRFKNRADPLNSPFTLRAERSRKLFDTECITFGIGAFQVIIVTKNRAEPVGSSVNRRVIRHGFWGAPMIDSVQCEHGPNLRWFVLAVF